MTLCVREALALGVLAIDVVCEMLAEPLSLRVTVEVAVAPCVPLAVASCVVLAVSEGVPVRLHVDVCVNEDA